MRAIRASLSKDPATANVAGKVKVIAHAGTVTLQGTLETAEIRRSVEQKATAVAGEGKVHNEIEVKAGKHP
jgi:osmotically-inducible protein OsmY